MMYFLQSAGPSGGRLLPGFSRLTVAVLCFYLVGCGNAEPATVPAATAAAEATAPAAPPAAVPYKNLSPVEFAEMMGEDDVIVLDVRTPAEIAQGKIEGAVEMDYRGADFRQQLTTLDKDKTYLVYCAGGGRSSETCDMLAETGFGKLFNLEGGYRAWKGGE